MRFRDGEPWQHLIFAIVVSVYVVGVGLNVWDKVDRVGKPDVGWIVDDGNLSPTRQDASEAGLRGGGRAIEVNGHPYILSVTSPLDEQPGLHLTVGATNRLLFERPTGELAEVALTVRPWEWKDAVFTEGATFVLGLLFFVVGTVTFVLRPFTDSSWALLSICALAGGALSTLLTISGSRHAATTFYFLALVGFVNVAPIHGALAFPVTHRLLKEHRWLIWAIYAFGAAQAALFIFGWTHDYHGPSAFTRTAGSLLLLGSISLFVGRCIQLSLDPDSRLVRQRARILLAGSLLGLAPVAIVQVLQQAFQLFPVDSRFTYWTLGLFLFSLGRVTLREEVLNAQIAVRRAILYGAAVAGLTILASFLTVLSPYAVAGLLLPLLYVWPRFVERLNRVLYPKRAHFPEILRQIGDDLADSTSVDTVLDKLASAPTRLCDTTRSVAFLVPSGFHGDEHIRVSDGSTLPEGPPLHDESIVRILTALRKTILRSQIAIQPHFSEIKAECYAGLERLGAEILLPIIRHDKAIGGLAIGPRTTADVYESAELDALTTVAQQAVQSIIRVEAIDKLRERENEFADLKRFFSPQVIDQVMARGGASELKSKRKIVTVLFADLRGFTSFSDAVEPEELSSTLAEYHELMGGRIAEYAGTLERFAGDGFMVFFNDPVTQIDHTERAVQMALAMRSDVDLLHSQWLRRGYRMHIGMGIHTGYATCGFVGYEGRRDYGVIGNVTNMAARLSDAAAAGEILITGRVRGELRNGFEVEPVGDLELKGFRQAQEVFRLVSDGHGDNQTKNGPVIS